MNTPLTRICHTKRKLLLAFGLFLGISLIFFSYTRYQNFIIFKDVLTPAYIFAESKTSRVLEDLYEMDKIKNNVAIGDLDKRFFNKLYLYLGKFKKMTLSHGATSELSNKYILFAGVAEFEKGNVFIETIISSENKKYQWRLLSLKSCLNGLNQLFFKFPIQFDSSRCIDVDLALPSVKGVENFEQHTYMTFETKAILHYKEADMYKKWATEGLPYK